MKKLYLLLIVLLLAGCASTKDIVTVVEVKNVLVTPPDELLVKCDVQAPPDAEEYLSASWQGKEELLVAYSTAQMKNLFKCNNMITNLQNWKKKQTEIYQK